MNFYFLPNAGFSRPFLGEWLRSRGEGSERTEILGLGPGDVMEWKEDLPSPSSFNPLSPSLHFEDAPSVVDFGDIEEENCSFLR